MIDRKFVDRRVFERRRCSGAQGHWEESLRDSRDRSARIAKQLNEVERLLGSIARERRGFEDECRSLEEAKAAAERVQKFAADNLGPTRERKDSRGSRARDRISGYARQLAEVSRELEANEKESRALDAEHKMLEEQLEVVERTQRVAEETLMNSMEYARKRRREEEDGTPSPRRGGARQDEKRPPLPTQAIIPSSRRDDGSQIVPGCDDDDGPPRRDGCHHSATRAEPIPRAQEWFASPGGVDHKIISLKIDHRAEKIRDLSVLGDGSLLATTLGGNVCRIAPRWRPRDDDKDDDTEDEDAKPMPVERLAGGAFASTCWISFGSSRAGNPGTSRYNASSCAVDSRDAFLAIGRVPKDKGMFPLGLEIVDLKAKRRWPLTTRNHEKGITAATWTSAGVATGGENHEVVWWPRAPVVDREGLGGNCVETTRLGHGGSKHTAKVACVHAVAESRLLSGGADGRAIAWDLASQGVCDELELKREKIVAMASAGANVVAIASVAPKGDECPYRVGLHDLRRGLGHVATSLGIFESAKEAQFSEFCTPTLTKDAFVVAAGSMDGHVHLWDLRRCGSTKNRAAPPTSSIAIHGLGARIHRAVFLDGPPSSETPLIAAFANSRIATASLPQH